MWRSFMNPPVAASVSEWMFFGNSASTRLRSQLRKERFDVLTSPDSLAPAATMGKDIFERVSFLA